MPDNTDSSPIPGDPARIRNDGQPSFLHLEVEPTEPAVVPATWGQLAIGLLFRVHDEDFRTNGASVVDVPAGVDNAGLLTILTWLVHRHETLRTVFFTDRQGNFRQRVLFAADIPLFWFEAVAGADHLDEQTERAIGEVKLSSFAHDTDPPFRVAVVHVGGRPARVVLATSHLASDFQGMAILTAELEQAMAGRSLDDFPVVTQPRQLSEVQQAGPGRRQSHKSIDHWIATLSESSAMVVAPDPAGPSHPQYWQGALFSSTLRSSIDKKAESARVSPTAVMLAAYASVLGELTGAVRPNIMIISNNRTREPYRSCVSTVALEGIFSVDLRADSFQDLVWRTWSGALSAYRNSQFDKNGLNAAIAARAPGMSTLNRSCFFNYIPSDELFAVSDDGGEPAFRWMKRTDNEGDNEIAFHVIDGREGMCIALTANTALLAPERIRLALRKVYDLAAR